MAIHARKVVNRFGLFQFTWPILCAYWTDSITLDIWALIIATNGYQIRRVSFSRFPWTVLMCSLYPVGLIVTLFAHDWLSFGDWVPCRDSPCLALQLVASLWATYAAIVLLRCYRSHEQASRGRD